MIVARYDIKQDPHAVARSAVACRGEHYWMIVVRAKYDGFSESATIRSKGRCLLSDLLLEAKKVVAEFPAGETAMNFVVHKLR